MSIRLRKVEGTLIALCAAETDPMPGDVYLDDGQHYALACKFWRDYQGVTIDWSSEEDQGIHAADRGVTGRLRSGSRTTLCSNSPIQEVTHDQNMHYLPNTKPGQGASL